MVGRGTARRHGWLLAGGWTLAMLTSAPGAVAAGATGAKLKVTVPSTVKKGNDYNIQIDGSFSRSKVKNRAFVISLIQFGAKPCKGSAQAENAWANRTNAQLQFYFAPHSDPSKGSVGIFKSGSPFTRVDGFTAGRRGTRRVCAYMYSKAIKPSSVLPPIARADVKYRVV